jgi:glycosyltransferase involved in cell wall biosynthesis
MRHVLFFVEGFTDIRFVTGLSEICDLTLCVPARQFAESGLKARVQASGACARVHEIPGGRLAFQARSLRWLWDHASEFDVIISQEVLRGSLNATLAGWVRRTPVITYMGIAPVEYFRCRRERQQIGALASCAGESVIRMLMTVNGRLAAKCLAMGPYLRDIAAQYCPHSEIGLYYGVDTTVFKPADPAERRELRVRRDLPIDRFVIFFSSRISHEKDPETVLRAAAIARDRGLDAVVINLGGGYRDFLALAASLRLRDAAQWVLGRPAAHPVTEVPDYFRSADVMALASLAEGAAYSTLEALACATPVAATAVGGMAVQLRGVARLTPRRDPEAMAAEFLWIAAHPDDARAQAARGREMVVREWSREKAFGDLARIIDEVAAGARRTRASHSVASPRRA